MAKVTEELPPNDCVICLQPTNEKNTDLFLYNCKCVYAIHTNCFRDWRRHTETRRICVICREGLESFHEELDPPQPRALLMEQLPAFPQYGAVRFWVYRRNNNTQKNICLAGFFILLTVFFFQSILVSRPPEITQPPFSLSPLGSQHRLLL
jgi:hypothetical protein